MFRSLKRLAITSSKSLRVGNELPRMNKVHLILARENISTRFSGKPQTSSQLNYYSIYFYKLVNDYFKSGRNYSDLQNDRLFVENCEATLELLKQNRIARISDKLSILRSLQTLGVPNDGELISGLIEDLIPELNKLNVEKALKVLMNQGRFQESEPQKRLVQSLVEFVESRQHELLSLDTILMIYNERIAHLFSKSFMEKVDKEAIMISKDSGDYPLKSNEISWILHKLSLTKRRPKPFIKFLVENLLEKELDGLDFNNVTSLLNSLANLNYLSQELMSRLSTFQLENQFYLNVNKFDFNQLLTSYIKLRYEPTELFDNLAENIEILNDRLGATSCMHLVSTMAFFNYSKDKVSRLLSKPLFKEFDIDLNNDHILHIDYAWSLAFYEHLHKVPLDLFTSEAYTKLLDNKHFYYLRPRFQLLYQYCKLNLGLDIKLPNKEYFREASSAGTGNLSKHLIDDFMFNLKKDHVLFDVQSELGFKFGELPFIYFDCKI